MKTNRVAIVIPVFNKFFLTALCLDSIVRSKYSTHIKIFMVDNGSSEDNFNPLIEFAEWLKERRGDDFIEVIRNEVNLGFSGGVNRGLSVALQDESFTHFCILNNDTILSDYVFDDLVLYANDAITGCVSNSIGNEQIVRVSYVDHGVSGYTRINVNNFAKAWRENHLDEVVETKMLGFLCVAMPRNLLEKTGLLDEEYGLGYYEDDDYCHRAKKLGFKLLIVRSAFVHHFGSASFGTLGKPTITSLFERNKKLFERKHGVPPVGYEESLERARAMEVYFVSKKSKGFDDAFYQLRIHLAPPPPSIRYLLKIFIMKALNRFDRSNYVIRAANFLAGKEPDLPKKIFRKLKKSALNRVFSLKSDLVVRRRLKNKVKGSNNILIVCPIQSYHFRLQRPQHIANHLAELGNLVIWIEPQLEGQRLSPFIEKIAENIFIYHTSVIDFQHFYTSYVSNNSLNEFLDEFSEIVDESAFSKIKWLIQSPFWVKFAERFRGRVIYDCMDFHVGFGSSTILVESIEERLIAAASTTIVSSVFLLNHIKNHFSARGEITLTRNACTPLDFPLLKINATKRKVVGYFGAVADWFDSDLLIDVARRCPEYDFEVIGNTTFSKFSPAINLPRNIYFLGERPYKALPKLCQNWSAGIIPFIVTDLIRATNPVKMYEYFALGLPVVATEIPEIQDSGLPIFCTSDPEAFAQAIRNEVENDTNSKRAERRKISLNETWEKRAAVVNELIQKTPN